MPGFNGMGPLGNGPLTGRGWGRCAAMTQESGERQSQFPGSGRFGRGLRNRAALRGSGEFRGRPGFTQQREKADELRFLQSEAAALEASLKEIRERLDLLQQQENNL